MAGGSYALTCFPPRWLARTREQGQRSARHPSSSRTALNGFGEPPCDPSFTVRDRPRAARARPRDESRGGWSSGLIRANGRGELREESSRARRPEVPSIESAVGWRRRWSSRCPAGVDTLAFLLADWARPVVTFLTRRLPARLGDSSFGARWDEDVCPSSHRSHPDSMSAT